ncbi:alpha/beta hydrolase [bacterium CPR1]|nr:alpha/beta hydrolase [bacterium CPR1]
MLTCLVLLGCLMLSASAQKPYVPVWVDTTGKLTDQAVADVVAQVAAENPNPDHIVVIVHGFATDKETSTQQYSTLGPRFKDAYSKAGKKAVVVGFQWDSSVESGLLGIEGEYFETIPQAHTTGRNALRQVLLALQQRFPKAALNIAGHSMGCEVSAAAVIPELQFDEKDKQPEIYQAGQDIVLNTATLAGSDLDYDIWYKGGVSARESKTRRCKLVWMTMSKILGEQQDEVLKMRAMVRGDASGNMFPLMTEQQYDTLFKNRAVLFDNQNIPTDHSFLKYYDEERLARIAPAAVFLADPSQPEPEELAELDQIIQAPEVGNILLPMLDSPRLAAQVYALWRMEHLDCGGSKHMSDGYLTSIVKKMRKTPRAIKGMRPDSECKTAKAGYWPTKTMMKRAGAPEGAEL